jgi:hypothetical protein
MITEDRTRILHHPSRYSRPEENNNNNKQLSCMRSVDDDDCHPFWPTLIHETEATSAACCLRL